VKRLKVREFDYKLVIIDKQVAKVIYHAIYAFNQTFSINTEEFKRDRCFSLVCFEATKRSETTKQNGVFFNLQSST
jgi:hypothetical protein